MTKPLSEAEVAFLDAHRGIRRNPEALAAARTISSADRPAEVEAWCQRLATVVPHLDEVLSALPDWYTPMDRQGFVLNAQVDDPNGEDIVGLVKWLVGGYDPAVAVALANAQRYDL